MNRDITEADRLRAGIEELHRPITHDDRNGWTGEPFTDCGQCQRSWPCPTIALLDPPDPAGEDDCPCGVCFRPGVPVMHVCATCGNKRCPGAADHHNACTGSNAVEQPGSLYAAGPGDTMNEDAPSAVWACRAERRGQS